MTDRQFEKISRYQRQMACDGIGLAGQRALMSATALVVGVGGLGSWTAELLTRAGVGRLRLVDPDAVELTNIHRQALYDQADAAAGRAKVEAAAQRLRQINGDVTIEPVRARATAANIAQLAAGAGVILDGTDNFATRFIINDFAVKFRVAWVFAGVVGAEAQTMTIIPGRSACLRCVLDVPPPPCADPNCRVAGVIGPAVAAIAAIQAGEALKILAGHPEAASSHLLKVDFWRNTVQRADTSRPNAGCPCCGQGDFEFLEG